MKLLDVRQLPGVAPYGSPDGGQLDLAERVKALRRSIYEMRRGANPVVKPGDSFGFAAAHPLDQDQVPAYDWKNPYAFTWFVVGWGPQRDRYIANAVRKLRPVLRTGKATLVLREEGSVAFKKQVYSVEPDGSFRWGDFPWGGGVLAGVGNLIIPVAVSCFSEVEDHAVALLAGGVIGGEMLKLDKPHEYGPNS